MIITHPSGLVSVYITDELKEHKQEFLERIRENEAEIVLIDKQIKLTEGETVISKVLHLFRRDRIV